MATEVRPVGYDLYPLVPKSKLNRQARLQGHTDHPCGVYVLEVGPDFGVRHMHRNGQLRSEGYVWI